MQSSVLSGGASDVYAAITDKIVAAIEAGAGEFVMPWHRLSPGVGRPANAQTGLSYQGVNVIALWAAAFTDGYGSGWWATYQQWQKLGAQVRRGEHATTVVFYKSLAGEEDGGDDERSSRRLVARSFRVFNQNQIEGWEPPAREETEPAQVLAGVEKFVAATGAKVRHGGDVAWYLPSEDVIELPHRHQFAAVSGRHATEAYYSTFLHELTHWSGAAHRLDRKFGARFGDEAYAMEELVAELGAAFLCADLGISNEPRPNHAAYVQGWLKALKSDRRAIFAAAREAKAAVSFLSAFSSPHGEPPF